MNKRQNYLPKGWLQLRLGDLSALTGGGTPSRSVKRYYAGNIPWVTVKDLKEGEFWISDATEHITPEAIENSATNLIDPGSVIIATRVGLGKMAINQAPVAINQDLKAMRPNGKVLPEFLLFLVYKSTFDILRYSVGTTVKGIRQKDLLNIPVVLPPLPVQERIVQILQKADEIRHKRKQALELVEAIRRSLFVEMFGDPASNPKGWLMAPLNELLDPAIERANPASTFPESEFTYIEIAGVKDFRIVEVKRLLGAEAPSRARQVVRAGDILYSMTRPSLRNIAVVPKEYDGAICTTGFAVLRPRNPDDSPFVFEIVKSDHFTEAMSRLAEAKSLYPAVDEGQVRQFQVIHPPAPARAHFGRAVAQLFGLGSKAQTGTEIAQSVFSSLLSRAFTGELTAEWEAANAEWIADQQTLYERLPRLLILALIAEKAKRARCSAEVLVTALMKYVFLFQMEGSASQRRLYHFVPYHYGPFAKELYANLEKLEQDGLISVHKESNEEKTQIRLADPAKAEQILVELPEDFKEDVVVIIETYGDLDHNALLETVYEKYPAYAKKSRLRWRRA